MFLNFSKIISFGFRLPALQPCHWVGFRISLSREVAIFRDETPKLIVGGNYFPYVSVTRPLCVKMETETLVIDIHSDIFSMNRNQSSVSRPYIVVCLVSSRVTQLESQGCSCPWLCQCHNSGQFGHWSLHGATWERDFK